MHAKQFIKLESTFIYKNTTVFLQFLSKFNIKVQNSDKPVYNFYLL